MRCCASSPSATGQLCEVAPHPVDYKNVPGCTYCLPQIASVGYTEEAAKEAGFEIRVGRFPFSASGKAAAIGEQAAVVWATIAELLAAAGMAPTDVVSVTTYAVAGEPLADVMAARDAALGGHRAASTLIPVPALARPEWRVEIAVVAAR